MNVTKRLIQHNFTSTRSGRNIERIIIHTYGGGGRSLYDWFNRIVKAGTSAHYAVFKDGNIEQYVEDNNTAWQAGNWEINLRSIGIEHQDDNNPNDTVRTPEQYEASSQLVASLCTKYNIPCDIAHIEPHRKYATDGRSCPGGLDINRIINRADMIIKEHQGQQIPLDNWQISIFHTNGIKTDVYIGTDRQSALNAYNTPLQVGEVKTMSKDSLEIARYSEPVIQVAAPIRSNPEENNIMTQEQVDQLLADKQRDLDIANSTIQSLTNDKTNIQFELDNLRKTTEEGFFKMKAENDTRVKALENTNKLLQERMIKYEDPAIAHELETYDAIVKENADLKAQLSSTVPTVSSVTAPLNPFDFSLLHNQVVINLEKKIGSTLFQTIKMRVSKPAVITFIVGLLDVVAKYYNEIYHTSLHGVDLLHAATYFLTTMAGAGLFAIINRGVEGYSDHKKADVAVLNKENQVLETPKTIEEAVLSTAVN